MYNKSARRSVTNSPHLTMMSTTRRRDSTGSNFEWKIECTSIQHFVRRIIFCPSNILATSAARYTLWISKLFVAVIVYFYFSIVMTFLTCHQSSLALTRWLILLFYRGMAPLEDNHCWLEQVGRRRAAD